MPTTEVLESDDKTSQLADALYFAVEAGADTLKEAGLVAIDYLNTAHSWDITDKEPLASAIEASLDCNGYLDEDLADMATEADRWYLLDVADYALQLL